VTEAARHEKIPGPSGGRTRLLDEADRNLELIDPL